MVFKTGPSRQWDVARIIKDIFKFASFYSS